MILVNVARKQKSQVVVFLFETEAFLEMYSFSNR